MSSKTWALLLRSLRVSARDLRVHGFRGLVVAIVVLLMIMAQNSAMRFGSPGLSLFRWLATANFWLITLAGASFFASSITEEREEGTLELLKLAGLGPWSILVGKALPLLFGAVLFVSVQFPFTLLAVTLGGVLWNQVVAVYLCLLAHLSLVAAVGILFSVISMSTGAACARAAAIWPLLVLLTLFISHFVGTAQPNAVLSVNAINGIGSANSFVTNHMAYYRMESALTSTFRESPISGQVISNLAGSAAAFLLAVGLFNPMTSREHAATAIPWWKRPLRRTRRRRSWRAALVWKDFHQIAGGTFGLILRGMLLPLTVVIGALASADFAFNLISARDLAETCFWVGAIALAVEIVINACRLFRMETFGQTWATLCLLPRSCQSLAGAKLAGAGFGTIPALALIVAAMAIDTPLRQQLQRIWRDPDGEAAFSLYMLFFGIAATHLGVWCSISQKWASWPVSVFLAVFSGIVGVMLTVAVLSQVFMFPGPNSCEGLLWTLDVVCAITIVGLQGLMLRRLRRAAAE
jgi:hypothetical protein